MTSFVIGPCCPFGAERYPGQVFAVPSDASGKPRPGSALRPDTPVRLLDFEPAVGLPVCAHEAAHAVVSVLVGIHVDEVVVGKICEVRTNWSLSPPITTGQTVMMLLAGHIAQNKVNRFRYRATDTEIMEFVRAARDERGGGCDHCRVGRIASAVDDADAIQFWRELERQTLELIDRFDVWRAIRMIADHLMIYRKIDGDEVRRIVRANIDVDGFQFPAWEEGDKNV